MSIFKDESIFRGIVQFKDNFGNEYRVNTEWGIKEFYQLIDGAFIRIGAIKTRAKLPRTLYTAAVKAGLIEHV